MLALVVMGATLTAFLPVALTQTMSDPRFATYLGIGAADLRIDLRPETGGDAPPQAYDAASGAGSEAAKEAASGVADVGLMQRVLAAHEEIEAFALYRSYSVEVSTPGRDAESLVVEVGDHHAFPVSYIEGKAPALPEEVPADSSVDEAGTRQRKALEGAAEERAARKSIPAEIALSYSAAQQLEVTVGDVIVVESDETREAEARTFTVSGIYQDLTNGGRSGKTSEPLSSTPLWQVAYATLTQPGNAAHTQAIAEDLATQIPGAKVTDISEYIAQTMGTVHAQLRVVSWVAGLSALGVIALITHLVTLLVCAREKRDREVLLRIGASPAALRRTYLARMIVIACGGTLGALGHAGGACPDLHRGGDADWHGLWHARRSFHPPTSQPLAELYRDSRSGHPRGVAGYACGAPTCRSAGPHILRDSCALTCSRLASVPQDFFCSPNCAQRQPRQP